MIQLTKDFGLIETELSLLLSSGEIRDEQGVDFGLRELNHRNWLRCNHSYFL